MNLRESIKRPNIRLIFGIVIALVVLYFLTLGRGMFGASADAIIFSSPNTKSIDKAKVALYKDLFTVTIDNNVDEVDINQPLSFHVEAGAKPVDTVSIPSKELAKSLQVATADDFGKFKVKMVKDIFGEIYKPNDIRLESVTRLLGNTSDSITAQMSGPAIGTTDTASPAQFLADYPYRAPAKLGKGTVKSASFIRLTVTAGAATIHELRLSEATDTDTWIDPDLGITTAPIIVAVNPAQAKVGDKTTLTGTSFLQTAVNTVKFMKDGQSVAQIPSLAATIGPKDTPNVRILKFTVPQLDVGTYSLIVNTRNGDSPSTKTLEIIVEKPTITSFTVGGKTVTEGTVGELLTINGLKFSARNDIYFDDRQVATNLPATNGTTIVRAIPDITAKKYKVTVRSGGQSSAPVEFTVKAAPTAVTITSFADATGDTITEIQAGQDLVIHGTNFGSSNAVLFNGKVLSAGLVSTEEGTTLQLRVPKSQKPGSYSVKVKTGDKESDAKTITVKKAK